MNNDFIQIPYTTMIRHLTKIHLDLAGRCFRRYMKHLFFRKKPGSRSQLAQAGRLVKKWT